VATTNVTCSAEWTLVTGAAVLTGSAAVVSGGPVEFATTGDDETEPTVIGYPLSVGMGITRSIPGFEAGAIWARAIPSLVGATASAVIAVNA